MKLLDYLYLLLLLLQGRGELESPLRKAVLRAVLGRAQLRQRYRGKGEQASQKLAGYQGEKDNTESEITEKSQCD